MWYVVYMWYMWYMISYINDKFSSLNRYDLIKVPVSVAFVFQSMIFDYDQQTVLHVPNKLLFFINISVSLKKI